MTSPSMHYLYLIALFMGANLMLTAQKSQYLGYKENNYSIIPESQSTQPLLNRVGDVTLRNSPWPYTNVQDSTYRLTKIRGGVKLSWNYISAGLEDTTQNGIDDLEMVERKGEQSICLFKKNSSIYITDGKDTSAIFSLDKTLNNPTSKELFEKITDSQNQAYRMVYQGEGTMQIDNKKCKYWHFIHQWDFTNYPCDDNKNSISGMNMVNEIYIDQKRLIPLKKIVFVVDCKNQWTWVLAAKYELMKF